MMRIVICEDDARIRSVLQDYIEKWSEDTSITDYEVSLYQSSEDLYEKWTLGFRANLVFLDIEFPNEMSGIDLAGLLHTSSPDTSIVFTTNYEEYVYQGYTFNALRYLKKPVLKSDVFACLDIVYKQYSLLHQESSVLELPGERIVLRYAEILYVEAQSPNLEIHTINSIGQISLRCRMTKIAAQLPQPLFAFCHRSYIVNISKIRRLKKTKLTLSNGVELPVSEKYEDSLNEAFIRYHQEGANLR